jgi:hypothetical protein
MLTITGSHCRDRGARGAPGCEAEPQETTLHLDIEVASQYKIGEIVIQRDGFLRLRPKSRQLGYLASLCEKSILNALCKT